MKPNAVVAYIPVIHRGYLEFFNRVTDSNTTIAVLGEWIFGVGDLEYFRKDVRRVDAPSIAAALEKMMPGVHAVKVIRNGAMLTALRTDQVVMPDDHVSRELQRRFAKWFRDRTVRFESVFLMWDRANARQLRAVKPDRTTTLSGDKARWMLRAFKESKKSNDWWRRVGAVAVRGGTVLMAAHNTHFPTEYEPYEAGDPRFAFHRGGDLDATTAGHAEVLLIARAAAKGLKLHGSDLYVTTFPCPPCAISIANAGIRRLYYTSGYSMVNAAPILRSRNVELIRVDAIE